jgi:hypothetical protein
MPVDMKWSLSAVKPFPEFRQYEGLSRIRNLPGLTL